jgi:hypothetical protein
LKHVAYRRHKHTEGCGSAGRRQRFTAALEALNVQQGLTLPRITAQQIIAQNVTPEVSDLSTVDNYPLVYVYCTK